MSSQARMMGKPRVCTSILYAHEQEEVWGLVCLFVERWPALTSSGLLRTRTWSFIVLVRLFCHRSSLYLTVQSSRALNKTNQFCVPSKAASACVIAESTDGCLRRDFRLCKTSVVSTHTRGRVSCGEQVRYRHRRVSVLTLT